MATKAEIKAKIVPRIMGRLPPLTAGQYLTALQNMTAQERDKLLEAWNSGAVTKAGRAIQRLRKATLLTMAETRADEILADDSIDLTEFDDIL